MSEKDYKKLSDSEKKKEDWMNSKWRPAMGWLYMGVCAFDFVIFPILWSLVQALGKGQVNMQWQPLTLQGAGLFHIAMGAVLGLAAYGRTQEKLGGANNGGINLPPNVGTTYTPPQPVGQSGPGSFGSSMATPGMQSFGSPTTSMGGGFGAASPNTGFGSTPLGGNSMSSAGFGAPTSGMPAINKRPMGPAQPIDDNFMPPRD